jgi:hypothetical protein
MLIAQGNEHVALEEEEDTVSHWGDEEREKTPDWM